MAKDELEAVVTEWKAAGDAWIEAKLKADTLEEDAKSFLASIINELEEKESEKISEAKLERLARGSKEYRQYIFGMCVARADALKKKVRFDALEKLFDARRSEKAFQRETVKQGIYHQGG
jgi:hypothetical protein